MTQPTGYDPDLGYSDAPYSPNMSPLPLPPFEPAAPPEPRTEETPRDAARS